MTHLGQYRARVGSRHGHGHEAREGLRELEGRPPGQGAHFRLLGLGVVYVLHAEGGHGGDEEDRRQGGYNMREGARWGSGQL